LTNISLPNWKKGKLHPSSTVVHRPPSTSRPIYVDNSLPSEATRSTSSRNIFCILKNPKFHYLTHNSLRTIPITIPKI
jgi:hypothetical protein